MYYILRGPHKWVYSKKPSVTQGGEGDALSGSIQIQIQMQMQMQKQKQKQIQIQIQGVLGKHAANQLSSWSHWLSSFQWGDLLPGDRSMISQISWREIELLLKIFSLFNTNLSSKGCSFQGRQEWQHRTYCEVSESSFLRFVSTQVNFWLECLDRGWTPSCFRAPHPCQSFDSIVAFPNHQWSSCQGQWGQGQLKLRKWRRQASEHPWYQFHKSFTGI